MRQVLEAGGGGRAGRMPGRGGRAVPKGTATVAREPHAFQPGTHRTLPRHTSDNDPAYNRLYPGRQMIMARQATHPGCRAKRRAHERGRERGAVIPGIFRTTNYTNSTNSYGLEDIEFYRISPIHSEALRWLRMRGGHLHDGREG